ncbi:MAG: family 20 glycosylhydrolase [Saprospiraceae bacterium]
MCTLPKSLFIALLVMTIGCTVKTTHQIAKRLDKDTLSVIPQPQSIQLCEGEFVIDSETLILHKGDLTNAATYLRDNLFPSMTIVEGNGNISKHITLKIIDNINSEGYILNVTDDSISIKGDEAGVFYGVQTLIQLLKNKGDNIIVPIVKIADSPRFGWRGMHLDVSRHFFDKELVKDYIDILAKHKLNVFHWHLTDDHGWRIEIDKYPKLTTLGAWRKGTGLEVPWNYNVEGTEEGKPKYGGYYTKEDIKEVLAYAAERYVTVVPEIELPAHSWGALHAYPNLSCTGKDWQMGKEWSFSDPFCAGNEETFVFFENVLSEVIDLFPSEYIHIGGDEAQKTRWQECDKCQSRIKQEGLHDEEQLQSYFIKRIEKIVTAKGRKIIGWDEILEGGLAPNAAVMSWRGEAGGIKAAQLNHNVVMASSKYLYFNSAQFDPKIEEVQRNTIVKIDDVYNYDPIPSILNNDQREFIIGVEACIWTEFVYSESLLYSRLMPRLLALSETAWVHQEHKNLFRFKKKVQNHFQFLDNHNIDYFIVPPYSEGLHSFVKDQKSIKLSSSFQGVDIRYTLDSTDPNINSKLYDSPIVIKDNTTIKAKHFLKSGKASPVFEKQFKKIKYQQAIEIDDIEKGIIIDFLEGGISELSEFDEMKEMKESETVFQINIPEGMPKSKFGLRYHGYIEIETEGIYTFYTTSDDGSRLYINDNLVVDNDGLHGMEEKMGEIALKAGYHRLEVKYFEGEGGEGLIVEMKRPNSPKSNISKEFLYH